MFLIEAGNVSFRLTIYSPGLRSRLFLHVSHTPTWIHWFFRIDFQFLFTILEKKIIETFKNRQTIQNFGNIFLKKCHITIEDFLGDWTNRFTVATVNFCSESVFWRWRENSEKIQTYTENSTNLFNTKKNNFTRLFIEQLFFQPIL